LACDTAVPHRMEVLLMRQRMLVVLLLLAVPGIVEARTKMFSIGVGINFNDYSDSRFKSNDLDLVPMYRFSRGVGENGWDWDLKTSIGVSNLDVATEVAGAEVQFGEIRTIPLLLGISRAYRQGPMKIGASVTAGPSFNDFDIDPRARAAYEAQGSNLEVVHAKTSVAFKTGISASYRLSSVLSLRSSLSYRINRPDVRIRVDGVTHTETWKLDRYSATVGAVLGLF
jgi:hypothetical protein